MTLLPRALEIWATENLLRGVPGIEVASALAAEGLDAADAERAVSHITASPIFAAARPFARDARRAAMLGRLRRTMAAVGTSVPRHAGIDAAAFANTFVAHGVPVVLTDLVTRWPGFGRWTPNTFAERFGDVEVDVMQGRESDPDYDRNAARHTTPMSMRRLVERISEGASNDVYLVARGRALERTPLSALLDEVAMPEGYLGPGSGGAQLWLGPEGTVTPLHHDTSNILFCQVHGRKRWRLFPPHEPAALDRARSLYSSLDPEAFVPPGATMFDVVLEPGEALFVPVGTWHHVRALDPSISVAFNRLAFPNTFDWYRPGEF